MSSHRSLTLALIAMSVALGACSFKFQAGMGANSGARTTRQAARPTRTTTPPKTTSTTTPTTSGTTTTPTTPATVEAPRITGKNVFGNGTIGAFKGSAYVIPNTTTKLPDLSKSVPFATLLTDSFIVHEQTFTEGFPGVLMQDEWFALRYDGRFDVKTDNTYTFKVISDDGAVLYIDGEKVVDNDGIHAVQTGSSTKVLKAGTHTLRLDYFQGARGPVALNVSIGDGAHPESTRPLVGIR
jgi:hypothetical protein